MAGNIKHRIEGVLPKKGIGKTKEKKKKRRKKKKPSMFTARQKQLIGILAGVVCGVFICWLFCAGLGNTVTVSKKDFGKYAKAETIIKYIDDNYYIDVDKKSLDDGMLKGIVRSLNDPYSSYMTKEEFDKFSEDISGEFCGIGIVITLNDKGAIEVVSTMDGTPAKNAGLTTGDIIYKVDGIPYDTIDEAANAMRGEKGTPVKVTYIRNGQEAVVEIIRDDVKVESVTSNVINNESRKPEDFMSYGYIKISQFSENTGEDFRTALESMEHEAIGGLIIDLRNNGGGLVDECLAVADLLLEEGDIVCYLDNQGNKETSKSDPSKTALKYVLLVNGGTASASEIVSAAVKDYKSGTIIGTKTFGKGIIQTTTVLDDGSALKLTEMQYLSPMGNEIHKVGIEPDVVIEDNPETQPDEQLQKAFEVLAN